MLKNPIWLATAEDGGYVIYFDRETHDEESYSTVITCQGAIKSERQKKLFDEYEPNEMFVNGELFDGT